jgi:hypothetical protein
VTSTRTCPSCHVESTEPDFCSSCGRVFGRAESAARSRKIEPTAGTAGTTSAHHCGNCGADRIPGHGFCEVCGMNFATGEVPQPPQPPRPVVAGRGVVRSSGWYAVVGADLAFFESNRAEKGSKVTFPKDLAPTEVALEADRVLVGRARSADERLMVLNVAELTGDPGISRVHAVLTARHDDSWAVEDTGSKNGTWVNADRARLAPRTQVVVGDGDRIRLGAFSVITMRRKAGVTA